MKYSLMAVAAVFVVGTAAQAATISVQTFSFAEFANVTNSNAVVEDFENPGDLSLTFEGGGSGRGTAPNNFGEIAADTSIGSKVGNFTGLGGKGTGDTCKRLSIVGNDCFNIALQFDPAMNGQGNIVPLGGEWSINAADTLGIQWDAFLDSGKKFKSLVFALRDVADQGATLTIKTGGATEVFSDLANDNKQLVVISFGSAVDFASVMLKNSKVNDSFTIDGAAINPVPLPAASLLLLGGLGLMAGLRRRKAA